MTQQKLLDEFAALPPHAQREVADFIAFLRQKYCQTQPTSNSKTDLADEEFIGMWKDRQDLADSSSWVREIRAREWSRSNG